MKKNLMKQEVSGRSFRLGGYSIALVCIVLAVLVAVNLIAGALPTKYTHFDVSDTQIYSLSRETRDFLHELDEDVTLYLVTQGSAENNDMYEVLSKYASESGHISVVLKDPALYPAFLSQYTDASVSNNSVVVESARASKVIDFNEIFTMDYQTYYSTGEQNYTYEGEARISAAIDFVTRDDLPVLYAISGHGEAELSDSMREGIENKNYVISDLPLLQEKTVPEDCDVLLLNAPAEDLSQDEAQAILSYLDGGGRMLLFTSAESAELPNLQKVTETYGMAPQYGIVMDADSRHYYQNYSLLLPDKQQHAITAEQIEQKTNTLIPMAHGIELSEQVRSSLGIFPLLMTSDAAYLKADPAKVETLEKEPGDTEGSFCLAAAAEEVFGEETTRVVWFASAYLDYYDSVISGANSKLVLSSLDWLNEGSEASGLNIGSKAVVSNTMVVKPASTLLWIVIMMFVIPVGMLVYGLVRWVKRRKR